MTLWRVLAVVVALLGFGVAWLPLRLVVGLAPKVAGFEFSHASGTIWKGRIEGLKLGGTSFGNVDLHTFASDIFTGQFRTAFKSDGPLASGIVGLKGAGIRAYRLYGEVAVSRVVPGAPETARVAIGDVSVTVAGGACLDATGNARVTGLESYFPGELTGPVSCEGGDVVLKLLTPEGVDAYVQLDLSGTSTQPLAATSSRPEARAMFAALGFAEPSAAAAPAAAGEASQP